MASADPAACAPPGSLRSPPPRCSSSQSPAVKTAAPASTSSATQNVRRLYLAGNERLAEQGLRVMATGRKDLDPASFDPGADLLALVDGLTLLALVGIEDPPRAQAKCRRPRAAGRCR